jgi:hypothetical protein
MMYTRKCGAHQKTWGASENMIHSKKYEAHQKIWCTSRKLRILLNMKRFKNIHNTNMRRLINGPCALGCSDLTFFHILKYNNPSLTPYGSKDLVIGKKISPLSMAWGNFCQEPENAFFGMISKFNFRNPVWQIFTI